MPRVAAELLAHGDAIILTHGGAGGWSPERSRDALHATQLAAEEGFETLLRLGDVLDAVAVAVQRLEDSRVLNAGLGSVLTLGGRVEMDAGVMSSDGVVGAVAGVRRLRNPVLAALIVARETPHILMVGDGADRLGLSFGVAEHPGPDPERMRIYFEARTRRRHSLLARLWRAKAPGDTVGAVAAANGSTAAATSTGGLWFKLDGRVGDTPLIGAGFYASQTAACSATGVGETIILGRVCGRIVELIEDDSEPLEAAKRVVEEHTERFGPGTVGVIIVARCGDEYCGVAATNAKMPVGYASRQERGSILVGGEQ